MKPNCKNIALKIPCLWMPLSGGITVNPRAESFEFHSRRSVPFKSV